jgi:transposase
MIKKVFSDKEIEKIIELYSNGYSCVKIGLMCGTSKTPILTLIRSYGLLRKGTSDGKKISLTNEQQELIKNLYLIENKNSKQISEVLNLNEHFIEKYLSKSSYRRSKGVANSIYRKGKPLPEKIKKNMSIAQQNLSKSGNRKQTGGICKTYLIENIICQGTYEKFYIEKLISENKEIPNNAETVNTPFGVYYPDFSFQKKLIEIKSDYTYDVLVGKKVSRFTKKIETLQYEKIKWVNLNYKPVDILIIDKKNNKIINKPIIN